MPYKMLQMEGARFPGNEAYRDIYCHDEEIEAMLQMWYFHLPQVSFHTAHKRGERH